MRSLPYGQTGDVAPAPDDLLDDREVSRILAVAVATLRNWRCLGRGPRYVRLGQSRMVRYRRADIEAYIRPGRVTDAA